MGHKKTTWNGAQAKWGIVWNGNGTQPEKMGHSKLADRHTSDVVEPEVCFADAGHETGGVGGEPGQGGCVLPETHLKQPGRVTPSTQRAQRVGQVQPEMECDGGRYSSSSLK